MSLAEAPSRSPLKKMQAVTSAVPRRAHSCRPSIEIRPARQRSKPAMAADAAPTT